MDIVFTTDGDLLVPVDVHQRLLDEAMRAHPHECCGILLGYDGQIGSIQPASNVHSTPATHFEIDPQALVDAHRLARSGGAQVIGYYHSHPSGQPCPSDTDQEMASADGRIWAIVGEQDVQFWRDAPGGFAALSYQLVES